MSVWENNIKPFKHDDKLKCKCGSRSYNIAVYKDDDDNRTWIQVKCKKCGNILYYNGA